MTDIFNHHTGEWEPLPDPTPAPPPPPDDLTPAEMARRFRVIITVAWLVFMAWMLFFIGLTYVVR